MKTVKSIFFLAFCVAMLVACKSNDDLWGDWGKSKEFPGRERGGAVTFTIAGRPYVGLGMDANNQELTDFWRLDAGYDGWKQVAPFPGEARYSATAFSDGQYGYVGLGYALNYNLPGQQEKYFKDFWRFDPSQETVVGEKTYVGKWEPRAAFPGMARRDALAFYIPGNNTAYVGTGTAYNDETKRTEGAQGDYWSYNPATNTWSVEPIYYASSREGAVAWVIGNSAYIATGRSGSDYVNEVLKFTPNATGQNQWTELDPLKNYDDRDWDDEYPDILRAFASVFVVGEGSDTRAFVSTGVSRSGGILADVWEFKPEEGENGRWHEVTHFPAARVHAVGFTMDGYGYVTTGSSSQTLGTNAYKSTYKFTPDVDDDDQNDD